MLSSVLKIEKLLKCDLCTSTLRQARVLRDCGHRFCLDCLSAYIKEKNACPTCELPASLDDLTKDVMHDNLVAYISKLKRALLSHTLTPLEESLKRREKGLAQQEEIVEEMEELSSSKKRVLSNTDTQDSENLEEEYTDLNSKRFKPSVSTENLDDEDDIEGRPRRTRHKNVPPPSYINLDDEDEDMKMAASILAAPPTLVGAPVQENIDLPTEIPESSTTSLRTPDATETSNKKWECTECHYEKNQSYMQICGVCKKSKNRKIQTPISTRTRTRSISNHNNNEESASTSTTTTILSKSGPSLESATIVVPQHRTRHMDAVINKEVHIIQTSLNEQDLQLMDKSSEKVAETPLKVTMYTELKYFDEVTHVISSVDNKKQCHRTLKYLHGLLLGKWIVSPQWYVDSIKAKTWLREEDYEILGDARAGLTHAPKKGRLELSNEHRLFTDMNFHLIGEFTDKHNKKDIGTLIQVGGGKFNSRKPAAKEAGKPTKKLDPTRPIIICSHPAKYPWIKEFQSRDPSWVVDCISKLKVE